MGQCIDKSAFPPLGTGTNACYIEELSSVKTWDGDYNDPKQVSRSKSQILVRAKHAP